jgi:hypothetical protein
MLEKCIGIGSWKMRFQRGDEKVLLRDLSSQSLPQEQRILVRVIKNDIGFDYLKLKII